jgi:cation:H+ antiporter
LYAALRHNAAAHFIHGRLFVSGAVGIAQALGISESVIAITVMALGTSMPELATSAVAAFKGKTQLALGNIIGSNIANISLILGLCAVVNPLQTGGISVTDMYVMLLAVLLVILSIFTFRRKRIDRPEGLIMVLLYCAYVYILATKPGLLDFIIS